MNVGMLKSLIIALKVFAVAGIAAILFFALSYAGIYFFLFKKNFNRFNTPESVTINKGSLSEYNDSFIKGSQWWISKKPVDVQIKSDDGLTLKAQFLAAGDESFSDSESAFDAAKKAKGTVILVHGFLGYAIRDFSSVYNVYHDLGFNVLLIDQRSHCSSEGKIITFGYKERYDLKNWILFVNEKISSKLPVVLDGASMGCATVLLSLGLDLPANVKAVVADCGYTTPYAIMSKVFKEITHLPVHPFMDIANIVVKIHAGFWMKKVSTVEVMKTNITPVFFAHGTGDKFVPCEMTLENYRACAGPKHLFLAEGADHCLSFMVDQERYISELKDFFDNFVY